MLAELAQRHRVSRAFGLRLVGSALISLARRLPRSSVRGMAGCDEADSVDPREARSTVLRGV